MRGQAGIHNRRGREGPRGPGGEAEEDGDTLYREAENDITDVNERFNYELERYQNGEMDKNEMFHLGNPQGVMRTFLPELPIVMRQRVIRKGSEKKHNVSLSTITDMPAMISDPIFVFQRDANTIGILTDMTDNDGKNVCVAIELGKTIQDGKEYLEVNDIRSFHGREVKYIVEPIVYNNTLRYANKEKGLAWLSSASQPVQQEIDKQDLISAANIVRNFENPSVSDENLREGRGTLTDDELSYENDPVAKMTGRQIRTARLRRAFAERERQRMVNAVQELARKLHLDNVDIVTDTSTLQGRRAKAKGFYSRSTGRITIVIQNHADIRDVEQTLLHEAVAHYGLRQLFGEHFDTFLDNVFQNADENVRRHIIELAEKHGWDFRTATEEYLASLAENTNFENSMMTGWWNKIKQLFLAMLHKIGFEGFTGVTLSDNELRYILWRSYENLAEPGRYRSIIGEVRDIAKQHELGVGNYATTDSQDRAADILGEQRMEEADRQFNEELERYQNGRMDKNEMFHLGNPQDVMRLFLPDLPIVMRSRIINKASHTKHNVDIKTLTNLPQMISQPIFVFIRSDKALGVLTEIKDREGKNVCVAIELNKRIQDGGTYLEVNDVRSIHGRDAENLILPIIHNNTLAFVDKEKGLAWLSSASYNYQQEIDKQDLVSAANIVRNFENPSVEGAELTNNNDKLNRTTEYRRNRTDKTDGANASRLEEANRHFNEELDAFKAKTHKGLLHLGQPGRILNACGINAELTLSPTVLSRKLKQHGLDVDDIKGLAGAIQKPILVYKHGDVHPNIVVVTDLTAKGGKISIAIELDGKGNVVELNNVSSVHSKVATTELERISNMRDGYLEQALRWVDKNKVSDWLGIADLNSPIHANNPKLVSVANILQNFENPSVEGEKNNDNVLYREADDAEEDLGHEWQDEYDRRTLSAAFKFTEAAQDGMKSVSILQDVISKETGKPIKEDENVWALQNRLSSTNKYEQDYFYENYYKPLMRAVGNLVKAGARYNELGRNMEDAQDDILKYLISKHGIERNAHFREVAAMEARRPYEESIEEIRKAVEEGEITQEEADKQIEKLTEQANEAEEKSRIDTQTRDYSGLSELYNNKIDFDDLAEQYVSDFESKFDTADLWNKINAATKATLRKTYEAGLISRSGYEATRDMYQYYIPLRGWSNDVASEMYNYKGQQGVGGRIMKRAKGRKSLAENPLAVIGRMGQDGILQANKNRVKQRLYNLAIGHDTSLLSISKQWYVNEGTKENPDWQRAYPELSGDMGADEVAAALKEFDEEMKALQEEGMATQRRDGLTLKYHTTTMQEQQHRVNVSIGGREYNIYVNGNPRAAQAINGELRMDDEGNSIIQRVNRWLANVYTSLNPEFVVTNYERDAGFAAAIVAATETPAYQAGWIKNMAKFNPLTTGIYINHLISKSTKGQINPDNTTERYMQEFLANGGETGFTNMLTADDYKKLIKKEIKEVNKPITASKAGRVCFGWAQRANRVFEDATRFATYVTSREQGRSIDRAIRDAKEISLNFNTRGADGMRGDGIIYKFFRNLRHWFIFTNPSIQGLNKAGVAFSNHPVRSTLVIAGLPAILGYGVAALASSILDGDDDEKVREAYMDLPKWIRRTNICIPIGGTKFITIPLSYELRVAYGMGEMFWEIEQGMIEPGELVKETVTQLSDLMPLSFANFSASASDAFSGMPAPTSCFLISGVIFMIVLS